MASVEEIVARHAGLIQDPKIWFAPRIPAAKVQGAIRSYAPGVAADAVLVLVDNTVWGGCGDGMLVTREHLYAHDMMEAPRTLRISEIKTANVIGAFAPELFVNGSKFVTLNVIDIHGQSNHVKLCQLVLDLASWWGIIGWGCRSLARCAGVPRASGVSGVWSDSEQWRRVRVPRAEIVIVLLWP